MILTEGCRHGMLGFGLIALVFAMSFPASAQDLPNQDAPVVDVQPPVGTGPDAEPTSDGDAKPAAAEDFAPKDDNLVNIGGIDIDLPKAERGYEIFRRNCSACHDLDQIRTGPPLRTVYGRIAGTVPGFTYSADLRNLALPWNSETLDIFLTSPRAVLPGTKMGFEGISDPQWRSQVIEYLMRMSAEK